MEQIKQNVGLLMLKRSAKALQRQKTFHNFDSAKTAGILFNATVQESYIVAKNFIAFLASKNIQVEAMGYVLNNDLIGYFPYQKGVNFFALNDMNWYGKPMNKSFHEFIEKPFDMLIDLSLADLFQVHYIFGLSKSKFKVGLKHPRFNFTDFAFDIRAEQNTTYFIEQLKHYMTAISKK